MGHFHAIEFIEKSRFYKETVDSRDTPGLE